VEGNLEWWTYSATISSEERIWFSEYYVNVRSVVLCNGVLRECLAFACEQGNGLVDYTKSEGLHES